MSIKKAMLLASMALAAVALAVPASAAASAEIRHDEAPATATVNFNGAAKFETLGSGIECTNIHAPVKVVNGTSVEVLDFEITNPTTECHFFGSLYSGCSFKEHPTTAGFPIPLDLLTEEKATVTGNGRINSELKDCFVTTNDLDIIHDSSNDPPLGITLDIETDDGFISGAVITGTVTLTAATEGTKPINVESVVGASGTLAVTEPETYNYVE